MQLLELSAIAGFYCISFMASKMYSKVLRKMKKKLLDPKATVWMPVAEAVWEIVPVWIIKGHHFPPQVVMMEEYFYFCN